MNSEAVPSPSHPPPSECSNETHPLSLPLFLTSSSSSLKPLRERNRTNLKRRINLSRSQVLSNDFENEDTLSRATTKDKTAATIVPNSQSLLPSTPTLHTYTELYSKTVSPTTPSPIHTTVTCSQVWERLASNEEQPNCTSPKSTAAVPPSAISVLPTHISFSYDPSDDDEGEELPANDKHVFQYVPVSSQSKLVQFQFLTFARQQRLGSNDDDDINAREANDSDDDEDEDEDEQNSFLADDIHEYRQEEEQEIRPTKKRKRSVSTADSVDARPSTSADAAASSTATKPPCSKKPKIKDPNANYQLLNMRKKSFSHAKKHQFSKHKRNAFYRRMRNAGGK